MLNIIKSDFYRLFLSKTLYVILLIMIVGFGLIARLDGTTVNITDKSTHKNGVEIVQRTRTLEEKSPQVKTDRMFLANSATIQMFVAILLGLMITKEFTSKAIKNTLSSAVTRKRYFGAKVVVGVLITTFLTFFSSIYVNVILRLFHGEDKATPLMEVLKITVKQFPIILGLFGITIAIAFLIRKSGGFYALAIMLLSIINITLTVINMVFPSIGKKLLPFDPQSAATAIAYGAGDDFVIKTAVLGLFFLIGGCIIGYTAFEKRDIT